VSNIDKGRIDRPSQYHSLAALSDELSRLLAEHERTLDEMHRVVDEMRSLGATWAVVGSIMGTSYQTAQKRFGAGQRGKRSRWRKRRRSGERP
jgi:hypothetical protein